MNATCQATIVIPLRSQRDDWLRQSVMSALGQTVPTAVVVVVSEHTPDSNLRLLEAIQAETPRLQVLPRPPGAGFAEAINLGYRAAETERVGMLFTDDWLSPETVARCLAETADIVATGRRAYGEEETQVLWEVSADQAYFERLRDLEARAGYIGHFFLLRREMFLAVGGVDPEIGLTGADDYDLIWTLLEQGASVRLIPEALYHLRDHDGERLTLRAQDDQVRDLRKILAKHGVSAEDTELFVERKKKWYGVPCHVAIRDPEWYLKNHRPAALDGGLDS